MSRLVWYPTLAAAAVFCAEPIAQGLDGLPECLSRFAVAVAAILADPTA